MGKLRTCVSVLLLAVLSGCQSYTSGKDGGESDADDCPAACTGGCSSGTCIVTGGNQEAICPPLMPCRINCTDGSCGAGVDCGLASDCHIRCLGSNSCQGPIRCGTGACQVECGGTGGEAMCQEAIDCTRASSCDIGCLGEIACSGPITCGPGRCQIQCGGTGTSGMCQREIDCADSCACDVVCAGGSSCSSPIACPVRCDTWLGCTSTDSGCDRCN